MRVPGGLVRAVCSAWRSSLRGDAAAPEAGATQGPCERGVAHGCLGGTGEWGFLRCTAAGAGWRSVCSSCCTAAVRVPVPLGRGVRERKRASSAWIPKEWHGRWGAGGGGGGGPLAKGATAPHLRGAASWRPGGKGRIFFNKNKTTSNSLTILPLSNVRLDHGVHVPTQATATQHKSAHGTVSRG